LSLFKTVALDVSRALAVLAMVLMALATSPVDATPTSVAAQASQLGSSYSALCGGDHQPLQFGCHAPNNCCRPDLIALPPRQPEIVPVFARAMAVVYAPAADAVAKARITLAFRSRAPPV
jgi:hypothetical protein